MTKHESESKSRWLSVDDIAQHLGVSKETIYRWAEKGKIPSHKVGRQWKFNLQQVDEWVFSGKADEAGRPEGV